MAIFGSVKSGNGHFGNRYSPKWQFWRICSLRKNGHFISKWPFWVPDCKFYAVLVGAKMAILESKWPFWKQNCNVGEIYSKIGISVQNCNFCGIRDHVLSGLRRRRRRPLAGTVVSRTRVENSVGVGFTGWRTPGGGLVEAQEFKVHPSSRWTPHHPSRHSIPIPTGDCGPTVKLLSVRVGYVELSRCRRMQSSVSRSPPRSPANAASAKVCWFNGYRYNR